MQIDQIILFKDIFEQGTISQAAKLSHISQPAATKKLQNLEEEMGVRLIERTNRGIKVTEAGSIFYEFTLKVTDMYEYVLAEITDWKYNRESLEVAACPVIANYVLPKFICDLKMNYPRFSFNIFPTNSENTISRVLTGHAKLGFCVDVEPDPELVLQKMFDDEIVLVACQDYEIDEKIKINDLKDHLIVILDESHAYYKKVFEYCRQIGIDLDSKQNVQQFYTLEAIKNLLVNCIGISLMPKRAVMNEIRKGFIKVIDVEGLHIPYEIFAISRKDDFITPLMMEIIEMVKTSD